MKALGYSWRSTLLKDISFSNDANNGTATVTKTYGNATTATSIFSGNLMAYNSLQLGGIAANKYYSSSSMSLSGTVLTITLIS